MAYTLTLTVEEQRTLGWVAERYTSAEVLYRGMYALGEEGDDGTVTFTVPEHVAWEYEEELSVENGGGLLVPSCVGGTLADKLIAFRKGIV